MTQWKLWVVSAVALAAVASAGILWRENRDLRAQLGAARAAVRAAEEQSGGTAGEGSARAGGGRGVNPLALLGALGRAGASGGEKAASPDGEGRKRSEDWEARRDERQQRMRDLLGRQAGESAEAYKARMAPMIATMMAIPRDRLGEKRRQFEEAAGVNAAQKQKLDEAFAAASKELVGLTNAAVQSGELTPYTRNTRGVLAYVGSTVGTVDTLYESLGQILTPEQMTVLGESGFDPLEYLGVSTPWENLDAPPVAPGTGGG